jgi:hypothetical protein
MFPHCSPLTELTGKGTFVWTNCQQEAFETTKAIVIKDCLVPYPGHNLHFHIYTNTSKYQLGAIIVQQNIPIAYYSKQLNHTQKNILPLKRIAPYQQSFHKFHSMLLGASPYLFELTMKILPTALKPANK